MDQARTNQSLLDELGLSNLPQEKKDALLIKMTEVILKKIFVEVMDKLNDQAKEEYEKLIAEKAGPEKMDEFLKARIANYDSLVEKVVAEFKAEMKGEA